MNQIYQDRILALAKAVRGASQIDGATHHASVSNPTCGDRVDISLTVADGVIEAASTHVRGCALCEAGAGLVLKLIPSLTAQEVATHRDMLKAWLDGADGQELPAGMEDFHPVRAIRNRHKCVSLAYDACVTALNSREEG